MRNVALTVAALMAAVFGLQNLQAVPIVFVIWQTQAPLALAMAGALLLGVAIGLLLALPRLMRQRRELRDARSAAGHAAHPPATTPPGGDDGTA